MQILGESGGNSSFHDEAVERMSNNSRNLLMPPFTMRSNFCAPLPEDFKEDEQAREETSYLTEELPDYESEESSFCLPDPLQLQTKFADRFGHSAIGMHDMHDIEEDSGELGDDVENHMHGDADGYRDGDDSGSIDMHVDDARDINMSSNSTRATRNGAEESAHGRQSIQGLQWVDSTGRDVTMRGGGRGSARGGLFPQVGSGMPPPLPMVPEECSGKISVLDGEGGSVGLQDSVN